MGHIKDWMERMHEEEEAAEHSATPDSSAPSQRRIEVKLKTGQVHVFTPDPAAALPDSDFSTFSATLDETGTLSIQRQDFVYEPEYQGWDVHSKKVVATFPAGTYDYFLYHL